MCCPSDTVQDVQPREDDDVAPDGKTQVIFEFVQKVDEYDTQHAETLKGTRSNGGRSAGELFEKDRRPWKLSRTWTASARGGNPNSRYS